LIIIAEKTHFFRKKFGDVKTKPLTLGRIWWMKPDGSSIRFPIIEMWSRILISKQKTKKRQDNNE